MRLSFSITQTIVQAFLAQLILIVFHIYATMDFAIGVSTSLLLFFFLAVYQVALGMLFIFFRFGRSIRMILIPLISSFLVSVTLTLHPAFGFMVDFWSLVIILFFAGVASFALLHSAGASWSETNNG